MNLADDAKTDDDDTNLIGNGMIQMIRSAPTSAERRIQLSLLLANRL